MTVSGMGPAERKPGSSRGRWRAKDVHYVGLVPDRWQKFRCHSADAGARLWLRSSWRDMSVGFNSAVPTESAYAGTPLVLQPNSADGSFPSEASDGQPFLRRWGWRNGVARIFRGHHQRCNDGTFVTKILHGASLQLFYGTFLPASARNNLTHPFLNTFGGFSINALAIRSRRVMSLRAAKAEQEKDGR
jgi:hypothetical protein